MKENREQKPDKYKELNKKHNNDLNKRRKAQRTLTNALKTRNAKKRCQKEQLKLERANETARKLQENSNHFKELIKEGEAKAKQALEKIETV